MKEPLSFATYERGLRKPFRYGTTSIKSRCGILLRRETNRGYRYAEAAPLPGHSKESLETVVATLKGAGGEVPASLRFAMESLNDEPADHFPIRSNALLRWEGVEQADKDLKQFSQLGYTHCKIKIGIQPPEEVLEIIEAHSTFLFRLDANQSLSPDLLRKITALIDRKSLLGRIDYLEEPFEGAWSDRGLGALPIALAADESAQDLASITQLLSTPNPPKVFVIKPTVHGETIPLLDFLSSRGVRAVLTTAIETEVGRRAIISILSKRRHEVAGLSTGFLFRENYLEDRALWNKVPPISAGEQEWLDSLSWAECKW